MASLGEEFEKFISLIRSSVAPSDKTQIYAAYDQDFLIETYFGEARTGLALIADEIKPGMRLLEIGSGSGLLASFLAEQGFDIVGLEPGAGPGFTHMRTMFNIVKRGLRNAKDFDLTRVSITDLDQSRHGRFDLIFSVNVLEHIPPIEEGFRAMTGVLSDTGQMIHTCVNYSVPYEPHFNIPLVPGSPKLSRLLFLRPEAEQKLPGIWDDLNWITSGDVKRFASDNGLSVSFQKSAMASSLRRLQTDPVFAARHGRALTVASKILDWLSVLDLVDHLPLALITPMTFRMARLK